MKVLVTGGRDFGDAGMVGAALSKLDGMSMLIHGGATGADRLCAQWAAEHGIHSAEVRALWDWFGRGAGPRRNEAMLVFEPDIVLVFPGGRGTDHMRVTAFTAGFKVIDASYGYRRNDRNDSESAE